MAKHLEKLCMVLLTLLLAFNVLMPAALAGIGDQPAKDWNLQGDIEAEKAIEGQMFNIASITFLNPATTATAVTAVGPFGLLTVGAGAAAAGLAEIARPENAIWENWPLGRYVFYHYAPDKYLGMVPTAQYATSAIGDMIANLIFSLSKSITRTSINVMVLAFHTDIVSGMIPWVSRGVADIFTNPQNQLAPVLLILGMSLLLIYSVFKLLRGQAVSVLGALLIALLGVGGVFFFTANAEKLIGDFTRFTDSTAGLFLGTISSYTVKGQNVNISNPIDRGLVVAGQTAWNTIITRPWAVTMFGTADESKLKLTQDEYDKMDKSSFPAESLAKIQPGMRIDTLFLGCGGDARDAVADILGRPNKRYLLVVREDIDHGLHPGTMIGFNPANTQNHIETALLTLLPTIGFAILIGLVGLSIIVCQAVLAALLLMLPLALFALMIPETGWTLAGRYFRTLIGFFSVKLIYGVYLSLVLVVATSFTKAVIG
ncbi:hypothetical protein MGLY_27630 [Neomoorella glycerini]|uniref:Uncharacterized protein n=1 Tax=Neomoorella glycerini TaxID=55779 RepID=A0A6I5ZUB4_9FIRM|nr:hypothetical protein [Moorella glycerini]QGP93356.1 hypothetical protein MGLY_27630 [Moorella glycerini]